MAEQIQQVAGVSGLAGRYATAIFELAREAGKLDAVAADLATLTAMLGASADLTRLVRSPVFSRADQGKAMAAVLAHMNVEDLTRRFIGLVAIQAPAVCAASHDHVFSTPCWRSCAAKSRRGSRRPIRWTGAARRHRRRAETDRWRDVQLAGGCGQFLLGGLIVRMGSRMIDGSLRTKLNNLQIAMKEVG